MKKKKTLKMKDLCELTSHTYLHYLYLPIVLAMERGIREDNVRERERQRGGKKILKALLLLSSLLLFYPQTKSRFLNYVRIVKCHSVGAHFPSVYAAIRPLPALSVSCTWF